MSIIFKKMLLKTRGVKNETAVAFGLILLALLVFLAYLFPGVSSFFEAKSSLNVVVGIIIFLVVLSFVIIVHIVEPIIKISEDAKKIADGDFTREIELFRDDEIGDLGSALNNLTHRIKENVQELETYRQTTENLNVEINKRIDILASILEVSNLISQNAPLKEICEAAINKCVTMGTMTFAAILLKAQMTDDFKIEHIRTPDLRDLTQSGILNENIKFGQGLLGKTLLNPDVIVVDKDTPVTNEITKLREKYLVQNIIIVPITSKGNTFGLLVAANKIDNASILTSESELLRVISKQLAIAIANDRMAGEIKRLEVIDNLTGLFNQSFVRNRLDTEIGKAVNLKQACSFVLFSVDGYEDYHRDCGDIGAEELLVKVAGVIKDRITGRDKAARYSDHQFAIILPGKNKRQSIEVAENIRVNINLLVSKTGNAPKKLTCTGSVTENPLDGTTGMELIKKAEDILEHAQKEGGNKIAFKI